MYDIKFSYYNNKYNLLAYNLFMCSNEAEYKLNYKSSANKINLESKNVKYMVSCQYNQLIMIE